MDHGDFNTAVILKTKIFSLIQVQGGQTDKSWHTSLCACPITEISLNMLVCVCLEGSALLML